MKLSDFASTPIRNIALVCLALVCLEAAWSFMAPSYNEKAPQIWRTLPDLDLYRSQTTGQQYSFKESDRRLMGKVLWLISDYHVNTDVAGYLLVAHDFPGFYFEWHLGLLTRPLYSAAVLLLAMPLRLLRDSYAVTIAARLVSNVILFSVTALLLFLLVREHISPRVAILSALLFIFSPMGHVWLIQPEATVYGPFSVMTGLYLLNAYAKRPTIRRLVAYSLLFGLLLLGKKMFAVTFFILLLGLRARRYRESVAFLILHLVPYGMWYLWVTQVWHLPFYDEQTTDHWAMGSWLLAAPGWPWYQIVQKILRAVPAFLNAVLDGFLVLPVIFAALGFAVMQTKTKWLMAGGIMGSFLLLFFIADLYIARAGFLLFPIVYPAAVVGIDTAAGFLKRRLQLSESIFRFAAYAVILLLSNVNVSRLVYYD